MEPERPIEKLLRIVAKKRRDQAGAPSEMPPATRRLLQNEVARRASKSGEESFLAMLFGLFRRRSAFAVCLVAAAGLAGVWLLRNSLVAPRSEPQRMAQQTRSASAADESKVRPDGAPEEAAAPARKAENERVRDLELASRRESNLGIAGNDLKQKEPSVAVAPSKDRPDADRQAAAISLSGSNPGYPVTAAGSLSELAKATSAVTTGQDSLSRQSSATNFDIAAAEASSPPGNGARINGSLDRAAVRYYLISSDKREIDAPVRLQKTLEAAAGNKPASDAISTPAPILTSFAVERNGQEIRIVDGDGSIYTGVVKPGSPPAFGAAAGAPAAAPAVSFTDEQRNKKDIGETAQDYYFEVRGTNQSLKQSIVFMGRFMASTNGVIAGGAAITLKTQPASGPQIEGTVLMDGAPKMEIRAAPAGP